MQPPPQLSDYMSEILKSAFDPEQFRKLGHDVVDKLADFLDASISAKASQVLPWRTPDELFARWDHRSTPTVEELFDDVLQQAIRLHHPRYAGHQISPPLPAAAVAGFVVDLVNNGMGVYEMGMVGTVLERIVVDFACRQLGFEGGAGGILTSGGSLANLTALLSARRRMASSDNWNHGTRENFCLLVSDQAHYSVDRAARIMGWGGQGVVKVPSDSHFRMRTDLLNSSFDQAVDRGQIVVAVVGSACSTATGSYDNLQEIGGFCRDRNVWFHVDGAHGASAAFSNKYRHLVTGIEQADSVTIDFHKMLLTPALASGLLYRDASHSFQTFSQQADYLFAKEADCEWFNLARRTFECTKAMISLKIYAVMASNGPELWDSHVTRVNDLAKSFAMTVDRRDPFELLIQPECNIVCFRYTGQGVANNGPAVNDLNARIRERLVTNGQFYIVQTTIGGNVWLRATLANSLTREADLDALLSEIEKVGRSMQCD